MTCSTRISTSPGSRRPRKNLAQSVVGSSITRRVRTRVGADVLLVARRSMPVRNCCLRPFRKVPGPPLVLPAPAPAPAPAPIAAVAGATELVGGSEPTGGRAPRLVLVLVPARKGLAPGGRTAEATGGAAPGGPFEKPRWPLSWSRNEPEPPDAPPMEEPESGATPEVSIGAGAGASGLEDVARGPRPVGAGPAVWPMLATSTLVEKRECVGELGALNCERRVLVFVELVMSEGPEGPIAGPPRSHVL